jgi:transcription initiation factor TFIID subunit 2
MRSLMKDPNAYLFNRPVDPIKDGVPDYFQVIEHPMDFGTIKVTIPNPSL